MVRRVAGNMQFNCPHCAKAIRFDVSRKREDDPVVATGARHVAQKRSDVVGVPGAGASSSSQASNSLLLDQVVAFKEATVKASSSATFAPTRWRSKSIVERAVNQHHSKAAAMANFRPERSGVGLSDGSDDGVEGTLQAKLADRDVRPVSEHEPEMIPDLSVFEDADTGAGQEEVPFSLEDGAPLAFNHAALNMPLCRFPKGVNIPPSWPCFGRESPMMDVPESQKATAQNLEFSLFLDERHNAASKFLVDLVFVSFGLCRYL